VARPTGTMIGKRKHNPLFEKEPKREVSLRDPTSKREENRGARNWGQEGNFGAKESSRFEVASKFGGGMMPPLFGEAKVKGILGGRKRGKKKKRRKIDRRKEGGQT